MEEKIIELDGIIFKADTKGYYRSRGRNFIWLHRYIWEKANGKIPEGHVIHHVDYKINGNTNNSLENLVCLSDFDHRSLHGKEASFSEKTRKKMSDSGKVKIFTEEARKNMSKAQQGRKHSSETKAKIGKVHLGKKVSPETRLKLSRKVRCIELDTVFDSVTEASKFAGLKFPSHITSVCKGKRHTTGGYHWEYV